MAQFATKFISLNEYLSWANKSGCTIQTGFSVDSDGDTVHITIVTAPDDKYVVIHDVENDEKLPSRAYMCYDRRLGLESPFNN